MKMSKTAGLKIRASMKCPYMVRDLVSLRGFLSYCKKNGVQVKEKDLQYFDKTGLLLPALYLKNGVAGKYFKIEAIFNEEKGYEWRYVYEEDIEKFKPRNIDEQPYYSSNGLSIADENSMEFYKERNLLVLPSDVEFQPWDEFKSKDTEWSINPADVEVTTVCYSKLQIYPLMFLLNKRRVVIKNEALFKTEDEWVKSGSEIERHFSKVYSDDFIRETVRSFYSFFAFFNDVVEEMQKDNKELRAYVDTAMQDWQSEDTTDKEIRQEVAKDAEHHLKHKIQPVAKKKMKSLMQKHNYSVEDVKNWRFRFLSFGSLSRYKIPLTYIRDIQGEKLVNTEDAYLHTLILSKVLSVIREGDKNIKQLLLSAPAVLCEYCKYRPLLENSNSKTCGSAECVKANKNAWKKEKYRLKTATKT